MRNWNYLKYVLKHKWYVLIYCWRFGLFWRGIVHDISKFRPSEWGPYRDRFFGPETISEETMAAFQMAWHLHQQRNRHHWQYWIEYDGEGWSMKTFQMPLDDALEMIADWMGAGRAITGRMEVGEWYEKNKDKMHLHEGTRFFVENTLRSYCGWNGTSSNA